MEGILKIKFILGLFPSLRKELELLPANSLDHDFKLIVYGAWIPSPKAYFKNPTKMTRSDMITVAKVHMEEKALTWWYKSTFDILQQ